MQVEIASVSTKGQVVIPGTIRQRLGIKAGSKLMVLTDGENVLMKLISPPQLESFRKLVDDSRLAAKSADLQPAELNQAVDEVRNARRR